MFQCGMDCGRKLWSVMVHCGLDIRALITLWPYWSRLTIDQTCEMMWSYI